MRMRFYFSPNFYAICNENDSLCLQITYGCFGIWKMYILWCHTVTFFLHSSKRQIHPKSPFYIRHGTILKLWTKIIFFNFLSILMGVIVCIKAKGWKPLMRCIKDDAQQFRMPNHFINIFCGHVCARYCINFKWIERMDCRHFNENIECKK